MFRWQEIRGRVIQKTEPQNLQLAPAAGTGIGKLLFDALLADPEFIPALTEAVLGGLKACNYFYAKGTGKVEATPDCKTRIHAATMILANAEGEPIKRVIHQHLGAGGALDIVGALRESPAVMAALERELDKAKWKGGKKTPKVAEPEPSELPAD